MEHLSLVTTPELAAAIRDAHRVRLSAFVLGAGSVLDALTGAAKHGAEVGVTLAGDHFARSIPDIRRANDAARAQLRRAGAEVRVDDGRSPVPPLHAKLAVVDGVGYLDERNWPDDGGDTIVRDDDPADVRAMAAAIDLHGGQTAALSTVKAGALEREAAFIRATHGPLDVATESFGDSTVSAALGERARRGDAVRLSVVASDVHDRSAATLAALRADGVAIRLNPTLSSEKAAISEDRAWVGSANATKGRPNQIDWGMEVAGGRIVGSLKRHFERRWDASAPFGA